MFESQEKCMGGRKRTRKLNVSRRIGTFVSCEGKKHERCEVYKRERDRGGHWTTWGLGEGLNLQSWLITEQNFSRTPESSESNLDLREH